MQWLVWGIVGAYWTFGDHIDIVITPLLQYDCGLRIDRKQQEVSFFSCPNGIQKNRKMETTFHFLSCAYPTLSSTD